MASRSRMGRSSNISQEEQRARGAEAVRRFRAREKEAQEEQRREIDNLTRENRELAGSIQVMEAQYQVYQDLFNAHNQATDGRFGQNTNFDFERRPNDQQNDVAGSVPSQSSGFLGDNHGFKF